MFLDINELSKSYGNEKVLDKLNFAVEEHYTLSILGKSGCGKTTLLKIIAGLLQPDKGSISLKGNNVTNLKPEERNFVYMYQEALLFPHLDVFENIAFGLRVRKMSEQVIKEKTHAMIHQLELDGMQEKMPHQLSGGQKQRVAFGRAIIVNPEILLLDEPFANLDTSTRRRMQQLFKRMVHEKGITSLFVTHNLKEAILMGDDIATLKSGQLHKYDSINAFIRNRETGVQDEIAFWESLKKDVRNNYNDQ